MVNNIKIALYGILIAFSVFLWQAWHKDTNIHKNITTSHVEKVNSVAADLPSLPVNNVAPTTVSTTKAIPAINKKTNSASLVEFNTPLYQGQINLHGGALVGLKLKKFPVSIEEKQTPFTLLANKASTLYVAQSGLLSSLGPDNKKDGIGRYSVKQDAYAMKANDSSLQIPLHWQNKQGIEVIKTYTLHKNSYLINVDYKIINHSHKIWTGSLYAQLKRVSPKATKSHFMGTFPTYTGAAVSSPDKLFHKVSFKEMSSTPFNEPVKNGWVAMIQHYFLTAWIPVDKTQTYVFSSQVGVGQNPAYIIQLTGPQTTVKPGQTITKSLNLYAGPEETHKLASIAKGLELTVDYGWFSPISQGLFWLMKKIHTVVGNWGLAIILVTLLIKLLFYRLSATSYRSMATMKKLQPKIEMLKKRYGDDKTKMSQEMMALYKKEKVNPLGGCLPMLIQIPFFIALYWVLIESVELRQSPFYFWIHDLSVKDPFYILPIIMGLSMLLQQKMTPAPADPMQAKMMMLMPIVFTFLFLNFPAGLMLYWIVNNLLSVLQQWLIMRRIELASNSKNK